MKLQITHPELAQDLISALNAADCVATRVATHTLEVLVPWRLDDDKNSAQAAIELLFFVRAWAASHPAFRATLVEPSY